MVSLSVLARVKPPLPSLWAVLRRRSLSASTDVNMTLKSSGSAAAFLSFDKKGTPFLSKKISLRPVFVCTHCVQTNTLSAQSVFRHVHAVAKNDSKGSSPWRATNSAKLLYTLLLIRIPCLVKTYVLWYNQNWRIVVRKGI